LEHNLHIVTNVLKKLWKKKREKKKEKKEEDRLTQFQLACLDSWVIAVAGGDAWSLWSNCFFSFQWCK
jgi:hypothetical protein